MGRSFDGIVVGGGGLGLGSALSLAHKGLSVALLDRFELASQTSPRAAGLAGVIERDPLQLELSRRSNLKLVNFADWTDGVQLEVHQAGGLRVGYSPETAAIVEKDVELGRRGGVQVELVRASEATELAAYFRPREADATISFTASDLYLEPRDLLAAYVQACRRAGVTLLPRCEVIGIEQEDGVVRAVKTSTGVLSTGVLIDAAGAWAAAVASLAGEQLPIVPVRHQLLVTEPLAGITNQQAAVTVADYNVYLRPDRGGLMFGGYEPVPRQVNVEAEGMTFSVDELELDPEPLRRLMASLETEVPDLAKAGIRELRGGIPTMTADGNYIIDHMPSFENFIVVGGCNVAGLTTSPAIGEAVAQLATAEEPDLDLSSVRISRFGSQSEDELRSAALSLYSTREQWV